MRRDPDLLTTSANRNLLQATKDNKIKRRTETRRSIHKSKNHSSSGSRNRSGTIESKKIARDKSASGSSKSGQSQVVDLVVEDTKAEEVERVRARKEGGNAWNQQEQKHFVRVYGVDDEALEGEDIREGFDPSKVSADHPPPELAISDDEETNEEEAEPSERLLGYGSVNEERHVWGSQSPR
jgi:hypothetical protein